MAHLRQRQKPSPELTAALTTAIKMHQCILEQTPSSLFIDSAAKQMFAAYYHFADDVFGSLIVLLQQGGASDGSFFALLRPLVETSVKAHWLLLAKPEEGQAAFEGKDVFPYFKTMVDELDVAFGGELFAGLKESWRTLNGFTHGGLEQVSRRFGPSGDMEASYSDEDKISALSSATASFVLFSATFCKFTNPSGPEADPRSRVIEERCAELYYSECADSES